MDQPKIVTPKIVTQNANPQHQVPQQPPLSPVQSPTAILFPQTYIGQQPPSSQHNAKQSQHRLDRKRDHRDLLNNDCGLPERLALAGDIHLIAQSKENGNPVEFAIMLGTLQRMALHSLEADLIRRVGRIHTNGRAEEYDIAKVTESLEHYCMQTPKQILEIIV